MSPLLLAFVSAAVAAVVPVIFFLLVPFIGGQMGIFPSLPQYGRAAIAANTVYLMGVLVLMWAFAAAPAVAGPVCNVASIVGATLVMMIMGGRQMTAEMAGVMLLFGGGGVWAYYAFERAPKGPLFGEW